jgi:hypothetical protein
VPAEIQAASPIWKILPFKEINTIFRKYRVVQVFHHFIPENLNDFLCPFILEIDAKADLLPPLGPI